MSPFKRGNIAGSHWSMHHYHKGHTFHSVRPCLEAETGGMQHYWGLQTLLWLPKFIRLCPPSPKELKSHCVKRFVSVYVSYAKLLHLLNLFLNNVSIHSKIQLRPDSPAAVWTMNLLHFSKTSPRTNPRFNLMMELSFEMWNICRKKEGKLIKWQPCFTLFNKKVFLYIAWKLNQRFSTNGFMSRCTANWY